MNATLNEAIRCANLAKDAYMDESELVGKYSNGFEGLHWGAWIENTRTHTQGFAVYHGGDKQLYCAFRGTSSPWDLPTDLAAFKSPELSACFSDAGAARVHGGFYGAFRSVSSILPTPLAANDATQSWRVAGANLEVARVVVTGHSLGGALANLVFCQLSQHSKAVSEARGAAPIPVEVFTFGAPPVGDSEFANYFNRILREHPHCRYACRVHTPKDPIATLDAVIPGMVHAGDSLGVGTEPKRGDAPFSNHSIDAYLAALDATD